LTKWVRGWLDVSAGCWPPWDSDVPDDRDRWGAPRLPERERLLPLAPPALAAGKVLPLSSVAVIGACVLWGAHRKRCTMKRDGTQKEDSAPIQRAGCAQRACCARGCRAHVAWPGAAPPATEGDRPHASREGPGAADLAHRPLSPWL